MKQLVWVLIFAAMVLTPARAQIASGSEWHWGGSLGYHGPTGDLSDFKPGLDAALILMRFRNERPRWFFAAGATTLRLDLPVILASGGREGPVLLNRDVRLLYLHLLGTLFQWGTRFRAAAGGGLARYDLGSLLEDASGVSLRLETSYNLNRTTSLVVRYGNFWELGAPDTRSGLNTGRWTLGFRWVPRAVKIF